MPRGRKPATDRVNSVNSKSPATTIRFTEREWSALGLLVEHKSTPFASATQASVLRGLVELAATEAGLWDRALELATEKLSQVEVVQQTLPVPQTPTNEAEPTIDTAALAVRCRSYRAANDLSQRKFAELVTEATGRTVRQNEVSLLETDTATRKPNDVKLRAIHSYLAMPDDPPSTPSKA